MKHVLFFATKEDIVPILLLVEANGPLKYERKGNFLKADIDSICIFNSGVEIPTLGRATANSSHACETYLVADSGTPITLNFLRGNNGVERVSVDQRLNPDTVTFTAGGVWNEEILLHGRVATASESDTAQTLIKRFQSAIKKHFTKVRAFYVGPQAMESLARGVRLTISAQSPRSIDLVAESPRRGGTP